MVKPYLVYHNLAIVITFHVRHMFELHVNLAAGLLCELIVSALLFRLL